MPTGNPTSQVHGRTFGRDHLNSTSRLPDSSRNGKSLALRSCGHLSGPDQVPNVPACPDARARPGAYPQKFDRPNPGVLEYTRAILLDAKEEESTSEYVSCHLDKLARLLQYGRTKSRSWSPGSASRKIVLRHLPKPPIQRLPAEQPQAFCFRGGEGVLGRSAVATLQWRCRSTAARQ